MARKRTTKAPPTPPADAKSIGKILRAAREAQGKTQGQVAVELGITQPTVHAYENDRALPDTKNIRRVARVYGVHPMQLLPEQAA